MSMPAVVNELRTASFVEGASTVLVVRDGSADLTVYGLGVGGGWERSLGNNISQVDLLPWGDDVLLVGNLGGRVVLARVDRTNVTSPSLISSAEMDGAWNGPPGAAASNPTLLFIEGQLAIAWQEGTAGSWKMAGRLVR